MYVSKTKLEGVLSIRPEAFEDHRGYYLETYNEKVYQEHGIPVRFVQDDISVSARHVLRGVHGDGHIVLSEQAIFHYKQSSYYNPRGQFTYKWNDPQLKLWWPIKNPILSQ